jgi:hypothetical protein
MKRYIDDNIGLNFNKSKIINVKENYYSISDTPYSK